MIVWAFTDYYYDKVSCDHTKVRLYSLKYYYHVTTSKYFLTNQQCRDIMFWKRKKQIKLQTWHGTALKKLGADIEKSDISKLALIFTPNKNKYEIRDTDIFIAGSEHMKKVFHSAYGWEKIYLSGTPRNDIFFTNSIGLREKVKSYYGIKGKKIILYAPTFRPGADLTFYDINLCELKQFFERKDGCDYIILVRFHPNIKSKSHQYIESQSVDIIDATMYPNVQELLYTADVLITDYSSVMFDFMYSYKPVILYVPDRNSYNRGFYFDLDKLPFIIVNTNSEIETKLREYDMEKYIQGINQFLCEIGSVEDGKATERIYQLIMNRS